MNGKPRLSQNAGFSLVEILIAMTIVLVIGGIAGSLLVQAFTLWKHGIARTQRLVPTDTCITLLARDFASAVSGLGLTGTPTRCQFWTLDLRDADATRLIAVDYEIQSDAIIRRDTIHGDQHIREQRFAPVTTPKLRYGAAEDPPDAWREEWFNPTNAPTRLLLQSQQNGDGRMLLRRTL